MPDLEIQDIPDSLYERLKAMAERHGRSLEAEVIELIDEMVGQDDLQERRTQALQRIIERRKQKSATGVDSVELLREDRER